VETAITDNTGPAPVMIMMMLVVVVAVVDGFPDDKKNAVTASN